MSSAPAKVFSPNCSVTFTVTSSSSSGTGGGGFVWVRRGSVRRFWSLDIVAGYYVEIWRMRPCEGPGAGIPGGSGGPKSVSRRPEGPEKRFLASGGLRKAFHG